MASGPSRRQVLATLFYSMASGLALPLVSTKDVFAHTYSPAGLATDQARNFNPATDIKPLAPVPQNSYPFVMVHGIAGFINIGIFNYWGGLNNIVANMRSAGHTVLPVAVGPFSSNWDRACELYAEIKGGTVDYGAAHASKYGHARFGRTYPGLYTQWGDTNAATGAVNKIHLTTHSMGGQTSRVLAQLLANGSPEEIAATPQSQLSPLFAGNKESWLSSIFTVTTPHNGASAIYEFTDSISFIAELVTILAAVQGDHLLVGIDFMLDQWGLARQPGQSLSSYIQQVKSSKFGQTLDNAGWDSNPDGATVINGWAKAQPTIYYFSMSAHQTHKLPGSGHEVPDIGASPLFLSTGTFAGQYTQNTPGHVVIDSSWWPNDTLVNTNSMPGPSVNSTDVIVPYNGGTPVTGKWQDFGIVETYGHTDVIGWGLRDVRPWYRNIAAFQASLPL